MGGSCACGPYRVSAPEAAVRADDDLTVLHSLARTARAVDLFGVGEEVETGDDPLLSNAQAHALRSALLIGGGEIVRVRDRVGVVGARALPAEPRTQLESLLDQLIIDDPRTTGRARTLLVDALSLADALTGTGERSPADQPAGTVDIDPHMIGAHS